jgi:hypothetical protein
MTGPPDTKVYSKVPQFCHLVTRTDIKVATMYRNPPYMVQPTLNLRARCLMLSLWALALEIFTDMADNDFSKDSAEVCS